MLKQERFQLILKSLKENNRVLLADLSTELNVSEDTIRRDIKELSASKLLKEVRGGAVSHAPGPQAFKDRENFATGKKQIIAKKAVRLLRSGQSIILDGGTSTLAVANMIPKDLKITVFTNSFPIVNQLEDHANVEVFFAGGRLLRESYITTGHDVIDFYRGIRADICFFGVCSIDLELGLTGHHYDECAVKKAMIKSSNQVVALATPEKINTAEAFHIGSIKDLSSIITSSTNLDLLKPYKEAGIEII